MAQRLTLHVTVVTAQQRVFEGEAEQVVAPGGDGQLTVLPRHAPLLTTLNLGEMRVREHGVDTGIFVAGGFLEVNDNIVTVLADDAERAEDIDEAHAQEARARAEARLQQSQTAGDRGAEMSAIAELERAVGRLRVAELQRLRSGRRHAPPPQTEQ